MDIGVTLPAPPPPELFTIALPAEAAGPRGGVKLGSLTGLALRLEGDESTNGACTGAGVNVFCTTITVATVAVDMSDR